jgi:hypothetical protein
MSLNEEPMSKQDKEKSEDCTVTVTEGDKITFAQTNFMVDKNIVKLLIDLAKDRRTILKLDLDNLERSYNGTVSHKNMKSHVKNELSKTIDYIDYFEDILDKLELQSKNKE